MSHHTYRLRVFIVLLAAVLLAAALSAAGAQAGGSSRPPKWLKQWTPAGTNLFEGGDLARAATGDLFVAGVRYRSSAGHYDWCVARYTESGVRKWVRTLATANSDHQVSAVATDTAGNVIVVGSVQTATHGVDWLVGKWSRGGKLLWQRQRDGTAHGPDNAKAVAVAADGSIVVVGSLGNAGTHDDGLIVKYSPNGKLLWQQRVDGPTHGSDAFTAVALDAAGNAYAAGYDYTAARADDALLIRYSAKGRQLWKRRWGDPVGLKHEWYSSVAVRGGYVAAAGITENDPNAANWENRGLLVKYATARGTLKWARTFENPTDPLREADWNFVGIDARGRVAAAGWVATSAVPGEGAWATTVYSAAGVRGSLQTMQGTLANGNRPRALLSTAGGTVYVTGSLADSGTALDLYTVALGVTGVPKWGSVVDDAMHASDVGFGLAASSTALYVGGQSYRSLVVLRYAR
jgi:hypothetical protein